MAEFTQQAEIHEEPLSTTRRIARKFFAALNRADGPSMVWHAGTQAMPVDGSSLSLAELYAGLNSLDRVPNGEKSCIEAEDTQVGQVANAMFGPKDIE